MRSETIDQRTVRRFKRLRLVVLLAVLASALMVFCASAGAQVPAVSEAGDTVTDAASGATDTASGAIDTATDATSDATSGATDAVRPEHGRRERRELAGATDAASDAASGASDATSGATDA